MFARVNTFLGKPELLDAEAKRYESEAVKTLGARLGFKGSFFLADRQSGKYMIITLWDTLGHLQESTESGNLLRARSAQASGTVAPPIVEVFDVAVKPYYIP